jgi:hypothetical protein
MKQFRPVVNVLCYESIVQIGAMVVPPTLAAAEWKIYVF